MTETSTNDEDLKLNEKKISPLQLTEFKYLGHIVSECHKTASDIETARGLPSR